MAPTKIGILKDGLTKTKNHREPQLNNLLKLFNKKWIKAKEKNQNPQLLL
jgi:hypothetical protein